MITRFPGRTNPKSAKFPLRLSDKTGSELTEQARYNLIIEHWQVKSKQANSWDTGRALPLKLQVLKAPSLVNLDCKLIMKSTLRENKCNF